MESYCDSWAPDLPEQPSDSSPEGGNIAYQKIRDPDKSVNWQDARAWAVGGAKVTYGALCRLTGSSNKNNCYVE